MACASWSAGCNACDCSEHSLRSGVRGDSLQRGVHAWTPSTLTRCSARFQERRHAEMPSASWPDRSSASWRDPVVLRPTHTMRSRIARGSNIRRSGSGARSARTSTTRSTPGPIRFHRLPCHRTVPSRRLRRARTGSRMARRVMSTVAVPARAVRTPALAPARTIAAAPCVSVGSVRRVPLMLSVASMPMAPVCAKLIMTPPRNASAPHAFPGTPPRTATIAPTI